MTRRGSDAIHNMVRLMGEGEISVVEALKGVLEGVSEVEAYYELHGEGVSVHWAKQVRRALMMSYRRIYKIFYGR